MPCSSSPLHNDGAPSGTGRRRLLHPARLPARTTILAEIHTQCRQDGPELPAICRHSDKYKPSSVLNGNDLPFLCIHSLVSCDPAPSEYNDARRRRGPKKALSLPCIRVQHTSGDGVTPGRSRPRCASTQHPERRPPCARRLPWRCCHQPKPFSQDFASCHPKRPNRP